ncbi:hypothetical protein AARAC_006630 [Aspergillus arachidicola]|uniref:Protein kinase domain-containing protein n=1 Tax=Aspergillus arachidicola TaxID=656916 RepID=A0A2G7EMP9_9EURO|nr:hypothetical protein AARAC_006630 [Aspergillus arachidicola]
MRVSPAWLALLYGVLSCGAWIEKTMNPVMVESDLPDLFHDLRENCAVSIAKSDLTAPGYYKVEAALMYMGIEYLGSNNSKTGVSILLGIISRLAIMMGYHRSTHLYHPPLRPFEVEMRRRCWLLLSVTDSIVALQSGLPRVIYQGLGDFTRPRNLLYEDLDPAMSILPPSRPETETPSRIMYMLALDDMLSVAYEITDITSKGVITPERTICLDQELKATRDRLPGALRMPLLTKAPEAQSDITIMQHTLEMIYQRSRCILHRQYLVSPQPTDIYRAFRWACVDAARCVLEYQCELFQDVLRSPGNRQRVWFGASRSVSDCLTAAMVLCLDVINESKAAQPFSESTRTELIQLLHKTYLSLKDTPRPSVEVAKAAERVATMLYQMGHAVTEGELRCSEPAAAGASQLPNSQLADHTAAPDEGASFPYTTFEDFLNGDSPLELFDWPPEVVISDHLKVMHSTHAGERYVRLILDSFEISGPYGVHPCLLYEPAGIDIRDYMHCLEGDALPENLLRPTLRFVLIALDYLHQANIIHTDVQPNNILLGIDDDSILAEMEEDEISNPCPRKQLPDRTIYATRAMPLTSGEPILADLGEARLAEGKQTGLIMPNVYRAPEVLLGMDWDNKVDIWDLGQMAWTLFEQGHLFRNISIDSETEKAQRFAEMISLLGPPPVEFLRRSKESLKFWDENGNWKNSVKIPEQSLEGLESRLKRDSQVLFLRFLRKTLRWLPEEGQGQQSR